MATTKESHMQGNIVGWYVILETQTVQGDREYVLGTVASNAVTEDHLVVEVDGTFIRAEWEQVVCAGEETSHMVPRIDLLTDMFSEVTG
jgi:hypothetical protein